MKDYTAGGFSDLVVVCRLLLEKNNGRLPHFVGLLACTLMECTRLRKIVLLAS